MKMELQMSLVDEFPECEDTAKSTSGLSFPELQNGIAEEQSPKNDELTIFC